MSHDSMPAADTLLLLAAAAAGNGPCPRPAAASCCCCCTSGVALPKSIRLQRAAASSSAVMVRCARLPSPCAVQRGVPGWGTHTFSARKHAYSPVHRPLTTSLCKLTHMTAACNEWTAQQKVGRLHVTVQHSSILVQRSKCSQKLCCDTTHRCRRQRCWSAVAANTHAAGMGGWGVNRRAASSCIWMGALCALYEALLTSIAAAAAARQSPAQPPARTAQPPS
jgi:hypothetical protein